MSDHRDTLLDNVRGHRATTRWAGHPERHGDDEWTWQGLEMNGDTRPGEGAGGRRRCQTGASIVEVLVALMIFSIGILALGSTGYVASRTLRSGRSYMGAWSVTQRKLDSLKAVGWAALGGQSGSETVDGYPVSWNVQGDNPRTITLVVTRQLPGGTYADTFVTHVAQDQ